MRKFWSRQLGKQAEDLALKYLMQHGLRLICQNFTCKQGEIDLIMREGESIIFAEVRSRSSKEFGTPIETIDIRKQLKLLHTADYYLSKYNFHDVPCRFDVVAITGRLQACEITWIKDAFSTDYN